MGDSALSGWSSLFASTDARLQFVAPIMKDGMKLVAIPKSVFDQSCSLWEDCLLGQFFGPPKIAVIQSFPVKLWGRNGRVDVIPLEGDGFLFKFSDPATKLWVLGGGPWFIVGRPLLLQKWTPGLTLEKLSMQKFPIWIVLHGVPIELLIPDGLSYIASAIGAPLSLDKTTEQRRRVQFARICVEVACGDDLPDTIKVDIEGVGQIEVSVEYT